MDAVGDFEIVVPEPVFFPDRCEEGLIFGDPCVDAKKLPGQVSGQLAVAGIVELQPVDGQVLFPFEPLF